MKVIPTTLAKVNNLVRRVKKAEVPSLEKNLLLAL
jgi:hypothetical protein